MELFSKALVYTGGAMIAAGNLTTAVCQIGNVFATRGYDDIEEAAEALVERSHSQKRTSKAGAEPSDPPAVARDGLTGETLPVSTPAVNPEAAEAARAEKRKKKAQAEALRQVNTFAKTSAVGFILTAVGSATALVGYAISKDTFADDEDN